MNFKVLIPQDITEPGKNYLTRHGCDIEILEEYSVESICNHVSDCDAILARTASYPKEVFEHGKKLKVIARHGVGYDNIDLEAANAHHVKVCYTPLSNSNSVAEHTIALILACAKNLVFMDQKTRNGEWNLRNEVPSGDITGKTLGIIGYGRIGKLVARKAAFGFDMKIIIYRTHKQGEELPDYVTECNCIDDVFLKADYVSIHTSLNENTKSLVNSERLYHMKNTAFLINTSRGAVVDEEALVNTLKEKKIAGAGLDVFMNEPAPKENPLFLLDNVIVSPHNAALTKESMDRMGLDAAKGIVEVLYNRPVTWAVN
ncbi:MAG: D-isomer specific 2-hydroxyacid dehydrogenase NAD-binding [Herbinix sp.]|jgi:D-3-phosphoglycerate dehydrogenase|nr:D-isomer specific 2-hydroxyacid dehydrogenase NAD-binding [Herbinix sp.]